jgi:hypothetical protein
MSFRFGSVRWDASFVREMEYVFPIQLFLVGKCVLFLWLCALFVQEKQGFSRMACRVFPATSACGPCTLTPTLSRLHRWALRQDVTSHAFRKSRQTALPKSQRCLSHCFCSVPSCLFNTPVLNPIRRLRCPSCLRSQTRLDSHDTLNNHAYTQQKYEDNAREDFTANGDADW